MGKVYFILLFFNLSISVGAMAAFTLLDCQGRLVVVENAVEHRNQVRDGNLAPQRLKELEEQYPGLRSGGLSDPAMSDVASYLKGTDLNWYQYSIPFPSDRIDPLYREVAKKLGEPLVIGGGSDLIDTVLLGTGKQGSPSEINRIQNKKLQPPTDVDTLFTRVNVSVPAWGGRPELKNASISVNGESGYINLQTYVENAAAGKPLSEGNNTVDKPFKHTGCVIIPAEGEARLYFRTEKELENFSKKLITLPDEDKYAPDWHLNENHQRWLPLNSEYALIVYARARVQGWRYSPKSKEVLNRWGKFIRENQREQVETMIGHLYEKAPKQGISKGDIDVVLEEFGYTPRP